MLKDKFVAFIDVLGFKKMVEEAEAAGGKGMPALLELLKKLGSSEDRQLFATRGPTTCPQSAYLQRDLDFRVTQISDCAILSAEVSPAGVVNLVSRCWEIVFELLERGVMCRGYITRGNVYHTDHQVIGTAYQTAYRREREVSFRRGEGDKGTPYVEVDRAVVEYVNQFTDDCVKTMFGRCVADDGNVTALFPFQRLSHSFIVSGFGVTFDADREKRANANVRQWVQGLRDRIVAGIDHTDPDAVQKGAHYLRALDDQLKSCDETDAVIEKLRKDGF